MDTSKDFWSVQTEGNENNDIKNNNDKENKFDIKPTYTISLRAQFIFSHTDESNFNLFKVTPALVAISALYISPSGNNVNYVCISTILG